MKMYLAGEWVDRDHRMDVIDPFVGEAFDTVPAASVEDVVLSSRAAEEGRQQMAALTGMDRYEILTRAVEIMIDRKEDLGQTITREEGKVISEGRLEVDRAVQTMTWSAEEAKRLRGETIPLDASPGNAGKFGFTVRVPVGIVAAIAPFNFPLNLVAHKVGPAIAAGNSVIIKPASDTPLSALKLTEILLEAGVPDMAIQCITGSGRTIGDALVSQPNVRKVTFTGSREIGERITKMAGLKKVTMELGSNSPLIVMPDADMDKVAAATAQSGYANAGQVCISTQRVIVQEEAYGDYIDALKPQVEALAVGDPKQDAMNMGPLVRETDAARVESWVNEAVEGRRHPQRCHHGSNHPRRRRPGHADFARRGVRPRSGDHSSGRHRSGYRVGERQQLRSRRGDLHAERRSRHEICPRSRGWQPEHQLRYPVPCRHDAVRRIEGQRLRQRRPTIRHRRDDRTEDGGFPLDPTTRATTNNCGVVPGGSMADG